MFKDKLLSIASAEKKSLKKRGLKVVNLPGESVSRAYKYFKQNPRLSLKDCFALVLAEQVPNYILLHSLGIPSVIHYYGYGQPVNKECLIMSGSDVLQEKIKHIERDIADIKGSLRDLSDIKLTVQDINTKLDERAKAADQRFDSQDKRINRPSFRFWSMIGGIGAIIVGYTVKSF